jgi:hypothetical protein
MLDCGIDFVDGPEESGSFNLRRIPFEADFLYSYSTAPGQCIAENCVSAMQLNFELISLSALMYSAQNRGVEIIGE